MFFTNRSGNVAAQAVVSRLVVRADWWFTTPCVIIQPISGIALAHMAGWSPTTPWLALSIGLYALAAPAGCRWSGCSCAWRPWRATRTRRRALLERYARYARRWEALGYPAFIAMAVTYYLMVNKPALWADETRVGSAGLPWAICSNLAPLRPLAVGAPWTPVLP